MTEFILSAAKLGRRSRKMRDMISEATRTIEDSQTAQALHGLLSLKQPDGGSAVNFATNLPLRSSMFDQTSITQALQRAQGARRFTFQI